MSIVGEAVHVWAKEYTGNDGNFPQFRNKIKIVLKNTVLKYTHEHIHLYLIILLSFVLSDFFSIVHTFCINSL